MNNTKTIKSGINGLTDSRGGKLALGGTVTGNTIIDINKQKSFEVSANGGYLAFHNNSGLTEIYTEGSDMNFGVLLNNSSKVTDGILNINSDSSNGLKISSKEFIKNSGSFNRNSIELSQNLLRITDQRIGNVNFNATAAFRGQTVIADVVVATQNYIGVLASQIKTAVDAASFSDGNIDLATGGELTIDGFVTTAGNRVLVGAQDNPVENGVYDVSAGSWTRSADFDNAETDFIAWGVYVPVTNGDTYAGTAWTVDDIGTQINIDTDTITFTQFGGSFIGDGLITVDGYVTQEGDRVLLMGNGAMNGVWIASAGTWVRSADYDTTGEVAINNVFKQTAGNHAYSGTSTTSGSYVLTSSIDNGTLILNYSLLVFDNNTFLDGAQTIGDAAKGLEYAADYSANYSSNSLVHRGFVDGLFTSGLTANNGLTKSPSGNIHLGGTLTGNTTIDGGTGFTLNLSTNLNVTGNSYKVSTTLPPYVSNVTVLNGSWRSIAYGNGLFVTVEQGSNRILTSPDGITWTLRTGAFSDTWLSVTYGNGLFVAVAFNSNRIQTSPDGINWTLRTGVNGNSWFSVTYGNGLFVATPINTFAGTTNVQTSPDGINWTLRTGVSGSWPSVTYGGGLFVAVDNNSGNQVQTSPDGITWTSHSAASTDSWEAITYGNGLFVAVAFSTTHIQTSPDGINWTLRTGALSAGWIGITFDDVDNVFIAVAQDGNVQRSSDGITWSLVPQPQSSIGWRNIAYGGGIFAASSFDQYIQLINLHPYKGIQYGANYSGGYTPRSLVDMGFVTGYTAVAVGNIGAANGLHKNGSTIVLGGDLTGDTLIGGASSNAYKLSIGDIDNTNVGLNAINLYANGTNANIRMKNETTNGGLHLEAWNDDSGTKVSELKLKAGGTNNGQIGLRVAGFKNISDSAPTYLTIALDQYTMSGTSIFDFTMKPDTHNGAVFTDNRSNLTWFTGGTGIARGIEYGGDYSAGYTPRSLVDYGFLTGYTSTGGGAVTASNGLTKFGSNIKLGGSLTGDTKIDGTDLYNFNILNMSGVTVSSKGGNSLIISGNTNSVNTNTWASIAYGAGLYVAISEGTNNIQTSPDGQTWTLRTGATSSNWSAISYGAGIFVAVSYNTNDVQTSADGITWTLQTGATSSGWQSLAYGNGVFVSLSSTSNDVQTSPDGINWTLQAGATSAGWYEVIYGNGLFVAIAANTTNIQTSPDGVTWTLQTGASSDAWYTIAYGNGLFVAVANNNNAVQTSPDGITWTLRTGAFADSWYALAFGGGLFVAAAQGSGNIQTSEDGINWTLHTGGISGIFASMAYNNHRFVAVALVASTDVLIVEDTITFKGVQYGHDYSSNYTIRSLVDKGYVDALIFGASGTANNGLTKTGSNVYLGGALTGDTTVGDGNHTLIFSVDSFDASSTEGATVESTGAALFLNGATTVEVSAGIALNVLANSGVTLTVGDQDLYLAQSGVGNVGSIFHVDLSSTSGISYLELRPHTYSAQITSQDSFVNGDFAYSLTNKTWFIDSDSSHDQNAKIVLSTTGTGSSTQIQLGTAPNAFKITDSRTGTTATGIQYAGDYSANFVASSLVNAGFVTGLTSSLSITASNGLTKTGNDISLGGTLSSDADVEGNSGNTASLYLGVNSFPFSEFGVAAGDASYSNFATIDMVSTRGTFEYFNAGNQRAKITLDNSGLDFRGGYNSGNGDTVIHLGGNTTHSTYFKDSRTGTGATGLEYFADYSANYSARSLVDKGFVTGQTSTPSVAIRSISANTTVTAIDYLILVNTSTSGLTVNLIASPTTNKVIKIKDKSGNANVKNVTINGNGHNIDGAATALVNTNYGGLELTYSLSDTAWFITGFVN